jgi:hypothetical protein
LSTNMADEKDNEDFATMFDEAPDGPASTDGDHYDDEPGYGLDVAPHQRDAKEAETEFNRLTADEVSVAPVSVPGEVKAQSLPAAQAAPEAKVKEQPAKFGDAFKQARAKHLAGEGPAVFDWNGKSYTTRLKGEAPSTTTAPTRASTTKWTGAATGTATSTKQPSAPVPKETRTPVDTPLAQPEMPKLQEASLPNTQAVSTSDAPAQHSQQSSPGASGAELRSHRIRLQKAYDIWQEAKNANSTWYGGKAVMRPGMKEHETEAEQRYLNLLRNPR